MTLIGLIATYLLARRFVGTGSAVMVVLLVVAFPGFARVAASFMTDVPAYALAVLSLLLGTTWLESGRRWILLACLGVGVLAVSIREFAIAAPGAVLVITWARSQVKDRTWLVGASALFALAVVGVLVAAKLIPGHAVPQTSGGIGRIVLLAPAILTTAAVLLPVLVLAIGRQMHTILPSQIFAGVAIGGLAFLAPWGIWTGGGGNFWTPFGLAGDGLLRGTRETVIGQSAWALSAQLAWTAGMLLATLAIHWAQRDLTGRRSVSAARAKLDGMARAASGLIGTFVLIYAGGLVAFAAVYGVWDRYLYPLVPAVAILILRWIPEGFRVGRGLAFSHGAFVWLAASAFVIAANSFAYDAARWREGEAALAMGYDARTIDAGYEWVGYHATGTGGQGGGDRGQAWFEHLMWPAPICAIVSNNPPGSQEPLLDKGLVPLDGNYVLVSARRSAYRQYLFFGAAQPLFTYGAPLAGCPRPQLLVLDREQ
jgi:4-amino-4-deoxy-L-arabinose transferase-like glycosyltransferase